MIIKSISGVPINPPTDPKKAAASSVPPASAFTLNTNGTMGKGNILPTASTTPKNVNSSAGYSPLGQIGVNGLPNQAPPGALTIGTPPTQSQLNNSLFSTSNGKPINTSGTPTSNYSINGQDMNVGQNGATPGFVQTPKVASQITQTPPAKTLGDANSTDAQKAALQSQIINLQNQITTDTNAGYSGNQQINTDANGNVIPNTGGTNAQSNYIQQQAQTQNPDLRQQVINSQAAIAPNAQANLQTAQNNLKDFQTGYAQSVGKIEGEPIGLDFQQGQKQVIANQYASSLPAYQTAVNTAQQALGQGVTANQNVISATQPQLGGVGSQQYYYPGSAISGGTQNGGSSMITSLAQQLASGNSGLDYQTAYSQLASVSPVLAQQLLPAIQAINPNFNVNQSNANAKAQGANAGIAAQVTPAINAVNSVLSNNNPNDTNTLQGAFNALGALQKTGSSILTGGVNDFINATGIGGTSQTQNFQRVLADSRTAVNNMLQTARNLGVDVGSANANALLPDNMTSQSLKQGIAQIQSIAQKIQTAYANAGTGVAGSSGNSGTPAFGNTFQ